MDTPINTSADTPINLIITKTSSWHSQRTIKRIDHSNYPSGSYLGDVLFEFSEYIKAYIQIECSDPTVYLTVQVFHSEELITIYPDGKDHVISLNGQNEDMVVPGYYEINIHRGNEVLSGFYMVQPSALSWTGLMELRQSLNEFLDGLAYNLYLKKKRNMDGVVENRKIHEIYNHIIGSERMLLNNINQLVVNPMIDITKEYREQSYSRRPDMKSQKWLCKKRMFVNINPQRPDISFEKHAKRDIDTLENRWIKKIICHTIMTISSLEDAYRKAAKKLKFEDRLFTLRRIKINLSHFLYETWMANIGDYGKVYKPTLRLLKEPKTNQLYNFYKDLIAMERYKQENRTGFHFKSTPILFEYYIVVILIQVLMDYGFQWRTGWLADLQDPTMFNGELQPETVMDFIKDNLRCEIAFDKEVRDIPNEIIGESRIVNVNSVHKRPDILFTVFSKDTGKILGCLVIEVKCSKARYIYDGEGTTRAIEQMKDYSAFAKCEAHDTKLGFGVVEEVILVYPRQRDRIDYPNPYHRFRFIQIEPGEEKNKSGGYRLLQNRIRDFINQCKRDTRMGSLGSGT